MSYFATGSYVPLPQYYQATNINDTLPIAQPTSRSDITQRKRPKYTRSKTGCLTCRAKKIKCDESKPACMRCIHGSRDCVWPDAVPSRKKSSKRDAADKRPSIRDSMNESSGLSESSTPPTREQTPPRRHPADFSMISLHNKPNDMLPSLPAIYPDHEINRCSLERATSYSQPTSNLLCLMPENPYASRYNYGYVNDTQTARGIQAPYRQTYTHPISNQWTDSLNSYYNGHHAAFQERPLSGHIPHDDDPRNRFQ